MTRVELWRTINGWEVAITDRHRPPHYVVEARRIRHADALEALDLGAMPRRVYEGSTSNALLTPCAWLRRAYRVLASEAA